MAAEYVYIFGILKKVYCTDSRAFSLYGNRLSKFRTQVKNTLIGVPIDDIIETSNHFGS